MRIYFNEAKKPMVLYFPPADCAGESAGSSASTGEDSFVLTPFQEAIMEALEGKALRTRPLGAAAGDPSRLYKKGGLTELRERGLVKHHPRLGFFRPDAPPEQLAT